MSADGGVGWPRLHLRVVDSTNARAKALAAAGAPHGTTVTAREQTAGRGRQGRSWSAPPGRALMVSVVVRSPGRLLPLMGAAAVAEAVEGLGLGLEPAVKWPNDVLLAGGRKVAGVLAEGRPLEDWGVLGVGLNVAVRLAEDLPEELRSRAGTLGLEPGALESVLRRLLGALSRWLAADDAAVLEAVRARDALLGRQVSWSTGAGVARGLDDAGGLVVERRDGARVVLEAGEVHLAG